MPRFKISSTVPCFVTWQTVIEAESLEAAKAECRNGTYSFDQPPEIGDSLDGHSADFEIEPLD